MHSILIIGQSNMAGRGFPSEVEPIANKNLFVLRNGRWWPMYVPVNPDRVTAGVSLVESFADRYARDKGVEVGIIPCADGGTCLDQWDKGGLLFDNAVNNAKLAMRTSTIVGVLWHQGESDCDDEKYPLYKEHFQQIMSDFRSELNLFDVPFILGGLGDYLADHENPKFKNYVHINKTLQEIAEDNDYTAFASAKGLLGNPDNMHFSADALYEFGHRYFDAFLKVRNENKGFGDTEIKSDTKRTEIELL